MYNNSPVVAVPHSLHHGLRQPLQDPYIEAAEPLVGSVLVSAGSGSQS